SAKGMSISRAVQLISGPQGSKVTLSVVRGDETQKDYLLVRSAIKVASVKGWSRQDDGSWQFFVDEKQKLAYVRVASLGDSTMEEFSRALTQITSSGGRGVILDLRYDPGGSISVAGEICDRFLGEGEIVSQHGQRNTPQKA